jgi:hypothetical protein
LKGIPFFTKKSERLTGIQQPSYNNKQIMMTSNTLSVSMSWATLLTAEENIIIDVVASFERTLADCKRVACSGAFDGDLSGVIKAEQIMNAFVKAQPNGEFFAHSSYWLECAVNADTTMMTTVPCVAALRGSGAEWPVIIGPGERESWRRRLSVYRQTIKDWQRQDQEIENDEEFDQSF